jgi:hypothetical protein
MSNRTEEEKEESKERTREALTGEKKFMEHAFPNRSRTNKQPTFKINVFTSLKAKSKWNPSVLPTGGKRTRKIRRKRTRKNRRVRKVRK